MTRGVGGAGLGLYICSELVSAWAVIWVESKEGEGSTFLIELPAEPASYARPLPGLARTPDPEPESAESAL
jgi:signal transduction histidine kinase